MWGRVIGLGLMLVMDVGLVIGLGVMIVMDARSAIGLWLMLVMDVGLGDRFVVDACEEYRVG